ncbi:hypothetical protein AAHC03_013709 [Spirometra sp. Aus1]
MPVILVGLSAWQLVEPSVLHYQECASAGAPMDYCTYDRGNLVTCIFETERNINACTKYLSKRIGNTFCTYIAADQDFGPFSPKCLACEVTSLLSAGIVLLSFFLGLIWLLIRFKKNSWVAHLGQAVASIICSLIIIGLQTDLSIIWDNEYENPPSVPENVRLTLTKGPGFYSSYGLLSAAGLMLILNILLLDLSRPKRRGSSGHWLHSSTV